MWDWLPSSEVRDVITWIGGGVSALVAAAWVVFRFFSDRTAMRKHRIPLDKHFPDRGFVGVRRRFCNELRNYLEKLEQETNISDRWQDRHFVPPDADVEILRDGRPHRRAAKLVAATRKLKRKRLFVVLGDPGAGKSLALRKLCRDLLREVERTDKVPIYVNLRGWSAPTSDNLPTEEDLRRFILGDVQKQVQYTRRDFLERPVNESGKTCFDLMLEYGRFFIILDSFDEIPAVLDVDDGDPLIAHLAKIIENVVAGGNGGRGIVASRDFRRPRFSRADRGAKPVLTNDEEALLRIRPFRDVQIVAAIEHSLDNADVVTRELFAKRPDLAAIAKKPFSLALMIDYWREHGRQSPRSQADLYESFIRRSLERAEVKFEMRRSGLSHENVLAWGAAIAERMYREPQHGLEMPVQDLEAALPNLRVADAMAVLEKARIGRSSAKGSFTFIHRRFHEYFLLGHLRANPNTLPLADIPVDRRHWESLVLFAEVAEEPVAKSIADLCWKEIRVAHDIITFGRKVHSLDTLVGALSVGDVLPKIDSVVAVAHAAS